VTSRSKIEAIAIFDIGKTNKKFYLFDHDLTLLLSESITLPMAEDQEGFPCEDLDLLTGWIYNTLDKALQNSNYLITKLNCSCYGATLVHLDIQDQPIRPVYNYLKPLPFDVKALFYNEVGGETEFAAATASPVNDLLLNSGLQLYWLRKTNPEIFNSISTTLHFPQFLSFLFSKTKYTEYTSIGCHTGLWDYRANQYHSWVSAYNFTPLLPEIKPTYYAQICNYKNHHLEVGLGIHDSSSALVPFQKCHPRPFLLLSTGTWSVALNPFSTEELTVQDIKDQCLNYMQPDGKPVRAAKLFLGEEYAHQVELLATHYRISPSDLNETPFEATRYEEAATLKGSYFYFDTMLNQNDLSPADQSISSINNPKVAYHRLLIELMKYQVKAIDLALKGTQISDIIIDGGFTKNKIFTKLIAHAYPGKNVFISDLANGSAIGAAMVIMDAIPNHYQQNSYILHRIID
jgi:L-fuculokinase